jgi:hypothetical protein
MADPKRLQVIIIIISKHIMCQNTNIIILLKNPMVPAYQKNNRESALPKIANL